MNVLLLGAGGREHALAWRISQSPTLDALWCAPGSDAIAEFAECVALNPNDPAAIALFARDRAIDLVVVGPEAPLAAGVSDAVEAAGVAVFGPSAAAARLETSKSFAREIADAAGVPGPAWARFDDPDAARAHVATLAPPIVVKADGLAAGKGVTVAASAAEAATALDAIFSEPGGVAVIEEFMRGEEVSLFALCDGEAAIPFGSAQDHKRAFDGDEGPNTGGMGAYAPAPALTPDIEARAMDEIIRPVLAEMRRRETPYRGVLYAGLMIEGGRARLVEFNARFGDPEAQVLAMRWRGDMLSALHASAAGRVTPDIAQWSEEAALCVVMATRGYPGASEKGSEIGGLDVAAVSNPNARIFHAGTRREGGRWLAQGGRVLGVCATGRDVAEAQARAYAVVDRIDWPEGFCRRDIGWRALTR